MNSFCCQICQRPHAKGVQVRMLAMLGPGLPVGLVHWEVASQAFATATARVPCASAEALVAKSKEAGVRSITGCDRVAATQCDEAKGMAVMSSA